MNNLQKLQSNLIQKLAPAWAADALAPKYNFLPKPIFDTYCYFRADNYMADLIRQEPSEYVNGRNDSPLMALAHKNEKTLLIYARFLDIRGSLMSWLLSWWWVVESEVEKEYRERMEAMKNV